MVPDRSKTATSACEVRLMRMLSASVWLSVSDTLEVEQLAANLLAQLNQPRWPPVEIAISDRRIACQAETWEPILRVRIEDALDVLLTGLWRDNVGWV
jgi:hypothetical protein